MGFRTIEIVRFRNNRIVRLFHQIIPITSDNAYVVYIWSSGVFALAPDLSVFSLFQPTSFGRNGREKLHTRQRRVHGQSGSHGRRDAQVSDDPGPDGFGERPF